MNPSVSPTDSLGALAVSHTFPPTNSLHRLLLVGCLFSCHRRHSRARITVWHEIERTRRLALSSSPDALVPTCPSSFRLRLRLLQGLARPHKLTAASSPLAPRNLRHLRLQTFQAFVASVAFSHLRCRVVREVPRNIVPGSADLFHFTQPTLLRDRLRVTTSVLASSLTLSLRAVFYVEHLSVL